MLQLRRRLLRASPMAAAALAALLTVACSGKPQPKTPLGQAATADSTNPHDMLSPAAKAALDSGNAQYRSARYAEALKSYETAASLSPLNAAPYFGVYMAADKLGNKPLADSANAKIRQLQGPGSQGLTDSALRRMHEAGQKKKQ